MHCHDSSEIFFPKLFHLPHRLIFVLLVMDLNPCIMRFEPYLIQEKRNTAIFFFCIYTAEILVYMKPLYSTQTYCILAMPF